MKYTSTFKLILLSIFCAFLAVSCVKEGPMGPAGADGTNGTNGVDGQDGEDGHVTCLTCHSTDQISKIQAEFAMSVHRAGLVAVDYAGGRASCAQCHSHEGFVQYAEFGKVLGDITNPTAWKCNTCHGIHKKFEYTDYAVRLSTPIKPMFNTSVTMDLKGNSNLCANCHQSRRPEPKLEKPNDATYRITTTHYGPHYGTQGNVVAGMGLAEIPGSVAYPAPGSNKHLVHNGQNVSCTACHMGTYGNGGGHTWKPNLNACNSCHNATEKDFNYGGVQTDIENKLHELREILIAKGIVAGDEVEGYHPVIGTFPMIQAQAFFNWKGIEDDRSLGVHNPKYVRALLINTIDAVK